LQIYFDFSGYSHMAIGIARIFGFPFPENFNYPYIAKSVQEFWQRWHISLSSWFRDYVYIPMGGNRVGKLLQYRNLFIVFLLCGLWHGASYNFIIWGFFHGLFLALEKSKITTKLAWLNYLASIKFLKHFYTLLVVSIGWVWFRSNNFDFAWQYLQIMFFPNNSSTILLQKLAVINNNLFKTSFIFGIIATTPFYYQFCQKLMAKYQNKQLLISFLLIDFWLLILFMLALIRLSAATHNPFIYFQF